MHGQSYYCSHLVLVNAHSWFWSLLLLTLDPRNQFLNILVQYHNSNTDLGSEDSTFSGIIQIMDLRLQAFQYKLNN